MPLGKGVLFGSTGINARADSTIHQPLVRSKFLCSTSTMRGTAQSVRNRDHPFLWTQLVTPLMGCCFVARALMPVQTRPLINLCKGSSFLVVPPHRRLRCSKSKKAQNWVPSIVISNGAQRSVAISFSVMQTFLVASSFLCHSERRYGAKSLSLYG